jgi:hypothetical protein
MEEPVWKDLLVSPEELRVGASLSTGQCFNWRPVRFAARSPPPTAGGGGGSGSGDGSGGGGGAEGGPLFEETSTEVAGGQQQQIDVAWVGVLGQWVVAVAETPTTTLYACLNDNNTKRDDPSKNNGNANNKNDDGDPVALALVDYFQLSIELSPLRREWCAADEKRLKVIASCIPGLRVLRQDVSQSVNRNSNETQNP